MESATVGPYDILEMIGCGGMGVVYRARHRALGHEAAVKVVSDEIAADPAARTRFRREAEALSQLRHANVVRVLEVGEGDGRCFIAMELVDGRTLGRHLKDRGALPLPEALSICREVASALGAAHAAGLVHRDVKPSNILIDARGRAKVLDFGIARRTDSLAERLTSTRAVVGTPHYMSPEQARGRGEPTPSCDVYSLGVVLYELLAGRHPLASASPTEALAGQLLQSFPPIRRFRSDIPDDVQHLLEKCLRKEPRERYPDGAALAQRLAQVLHRLDGGNLRNRTLTVTGDAASLTGTALHYIDARPEAESDEGALLRLVREAVAQCVDPNRRQRRRLNRLAEGMRAPRARLTAVEAEIAELERRQAEHEERARDQAQRIARLVGENRAVESAEAADSEGRHTRWALQYAGEIKKLRFELARVERELEPLRREYSLFEDRVYLADCEARRGGRLIPSWQTDRPLAQQGRVLRYGAVILLLLLIWLGQWSLAVLYVVFAYVLARYATAGRGAATRAV